MPETSFHTTYSDNQYLLARTENGSQSGLQRHECHRFGFQGQENQSESALLHRYMSPIANPHHVSFLMKTTRIILLAFFCLFFSNGNIAQTFDQADSSDYQLKIVKEFNDTIISYGTSQYTDSCFFKDGIWLIYSKDDTTKLLQTVSIFNKKRNGITRINFSDKSYLSILYYENSAKSRSLVIHQEDILENRDYKSYYLIIYNGTLSYYESNKLMVLVLFEKNIPVVSYHYLNGTLSEVIAYDKKGRPVSHNR